MRKSFAFGDYLPDQPTLGNPGLKVADGVLPIAGGYKPLPAFTASVNGTLGAACLGAASFWSKAGVVFTIAGTAANLYRYTGAGWSFISGGFSATKWVFLQWGDLILASNGADAIQKLDMSAGSPTFVALLGSPPIAEQMAVVQSFVVCGRAATDAMRVQWSANDDAEGWTVGTAESDYQILPTGGRINGIAGGEYGLIFQENRIVRMSYVGGDVVFQFDEIASDIGSLSAGSLAKVGGLTYFLSQQGFAVCDGTAVTPIGNEKINRTLLAEIDRAYLGNMSAAVDQRRSLIFWAIPNASTSTKIYIYNYALDRWSTVTQTVQRLFSGLSGSVTLEELDALYPSLDDMVLSLDDVSFQGGYPLLSVIDGNTALGTFSGAASAATLTTGDLALAAPQRVRLREVTPGVDVTSGMTLTVSGRNRYGDSLTSASYSTLNRRGAFKVRESWMTVRFSLAIAAGTVWTEAVGLDVEYERGGL